MWYKFINSIFIFNILWGRLSLMLMEILDEIYKLSSHFVDVIVNASILKFSRSVTAY